MNTVSYNSVANWWNGKVVIDEIKTFDDIRGMVSEVWRSDDVNGENSKQCYISETEPYVQRGPHSHLSQCDFFISWKNTMVYQMFNPITKEMKTFITDNTKITRVFVDIGIIHSYRNLDGQKAFTLNFPTSLFMGKDKKEKVDEIRHEEKYKNNDVIIVFGAAGRLGNALTNQFFQEMGEHKFDVIPSYEKLYNKEEVNDLFKKFDKVIEGNRNVFFINCAALTNVQDANTLDKVWEWSNVEIPLEFAKKCNERRWNFVQFSTDYVFQKVQKGVHGYNLSSYTRSKIEMEKALEVPGLEKVSIIRVANLYDVNDDHNVISKMKNTLKTKGSLKVDPRVRLFPSDVKCIAQEVFNLYKNDYIKNGNSKYINFIPKQSYMTVEFAEKFYGITPESENAKIEPWHNHFYTSKDVIFFDNNEQSIINLINRP